MRVAQPTASSTGTVQHRDVPAMAGSPTNSATSSTTSSTTSSASCRRDHRKSARHWDKPQALLLLALLSQVTPGEAFVSDMQSLFHFGGRHDAPLRLYRGPHGWRRTRPDAPAPLRIMGDLDLVNVPVRHLRQGVSVVAAETTIERINDEQAVDGRLEDRPQEHGVDAEHPDAGDPEGDANLVRPVQPIVKKNYPADVDEEYDDDAADYDDAVLVPGTLSPGKATAPFWHWPCGRSVDLMVVPAGRPRAKGHRKTKSVGRRINDALEKVWRQLNMTVLHYRLQRFDKLYYQVVIGVNEGHYIPSWVPDKDDFPKLSLDDIRSSHKLAHELTRMHTQLQKFSVALEQMSEDNRKDDPLRHNALSKTKNYVKMLLCEVEWALLSLAIPLPSAVPSDIMSPAERNIADNTNRAIRDWGVLIKYRDFLHAWADIVARAGRERAQAEEEAASHPDSRPDSPAGPAAAGPDSSDTANTAIEGREGS